MHCLFCLLKGVSGTANMLKRLYVLFGLYSEGYWRCRQWPLCCHKYFVVQYPATLALQLNSVTFVLFLGFCIMRDLGIIANISCTPIKIGYNINQKN